MSKNLLSKKERKKEWRQRKRLADKLRTGPPLSIKNGYGVVDLTAYNATRLIREEPEKVIFSRGKLREC
jgi:hypothetical protein